MGSCEMKTIRRLSRSNLRIVTYSKLKITNGTLLHFILSLVISGESLVSWERRWAWLLAWFSSEFLTFLL